MKIEEIILSKERNVRLKAIVQDIEGDYGWDIKVRPSVLILPGGGYKICSDKESEPVAAAFLRAGFNAFILRYTLKDKGAWDLPLKDYEQSMELISSNAEKWHVATDKLAVIGFSAGGHLAAYAATHATRRPAAAILGYAALSGEVCDQIIPEQKIPHPADLVDKNTCPCFLFACRDDSAVDITNSLNFEQALCKHGITFESHIYSYGNHGFSTGDHMINNVPITPRAVKWVDDAIGWLNEYFGEFTYFGFGTPKFLKFVNADECDFLSVKCSLGHVFAHKNEISPLLDNAIAGYELILEKRGLTSPTARAVIEKQYKLIDILKMLNFDEQQTNSIDSELRKIHS